ncbi:transforming growth factor beta regulator 1 [Cuculus canorus]|uniref:transforming growth factor beta regulator 1 n=1 Tax=Cuculus canorus TaxID=55661 RepID=UPI0023AA51E9|nr:transforming growth factor beta regulator 1 [Cuculus canorus]
MPKAARPRPGERYRWLRRAARTLVLENGALCDEVARLEVKWLRAREERRFLLARLLQLRAGNLSGEGTTPRQRRGGGSREASSDGPGGDGRWSTTSRDGGGAPPGPPPTSPWSSWTTDGPRPREEPKEPPQPLHPNPRDTSKPPDGPREAPKDLFKPSAPPEPPLEPPGGAPRVDFPVPSAILRPEGTSKGRRRGGTVTLPLTLGPLTVHHLGVVPMGSTLPIGFHSTRIFTSVHHPTRRCLYACRVLQGPRCEIEAQEESGDVVWGSTPALCYQRLLRLLGEPSGSSGGGGGGGGDDFFGLSHPTVRRLLRGEKGEEEKGGGGGEDNDDEEDEEDDDDEEDEEDDDDEEEEDEDEGLHAAFGYRDLFLASPNGSDE